MSVQPDEVLLGFTRALRSAGVRVTHDRAAAFLEATALLDAAQPRAVYVAGRATLCSSPDDRERFDQVFEAWFAAFEGLPSEVPRQAGTSTRNPLPLDDRESAGTADGGDRIEAVASRVEVLRHRDVASLTPREKALLDALLGALRPRHPRRRAPRRTPHRRGDVDLQRTLRASLRNMGEPGRISYRHRGTQPRSLVVLIDVSASMRPYIDSVLRLVHRYAGAHTEIFTLGTRLTQITGPMRTSDVERAMVRAGDEVADWAGGTRLGETLRAFNDRWGARGVARGAVVVVISDGWEQGDAIELGEQVARLHRLAHRLVWVNPHRGKEGYQPLQQGIKAVLPHVDDFVAGHSLRAFEELVEVIAHA